MLSDIKYITENYAVNLSIENNVFKNNNDCALFDLITCLLSKYNKVNEQTELNELYEIILNTPEIIESLLTMLDKLIYFEYAYNIIPFEFFEYIFKNVADRGLIVNLIESFNKSHNEQNESILNDAYCFAMDFLLDNKDEQITFAELANKFADELEEDKPTLLLLIDIIFNYNYYIKREFNISNNILPENIEGIIFILTLKALERFEYNALLSLIINDKKQYESFAVINKLYHKIANKLLHISPNEEDNKEILQYCNFVNFHPAKINDDIYYLISMLKMDESDNISEVKYRYYFNYLFNYLALNVILFEDEKDTKIFINLVKSLNSKMLICNDGKLIINDKIFNLINEHIKQKRIGTRIINRLATYDNALINIYNDINKDIIKREIIEMEQKRELLGSPRRRIIRT